MDIDLFRIVSVLLWTTVCVLLAPSPWRTLVGRPQAADDWKTALFFVGLIMIGFIGRWLLFPDQSTVYVMLYVLNWGLAVYVMLLLWNRRK